MKIKLFALMLLTVFLSSAKSFSQSLPPAEFKEKLVKEKGILIDVRTPDEFATERIEGAININVNDDSFKSEVAKLDKKKYYFLYCGIGKRSMNALEIMKGEGFKKVYALDKGLNEWKSQGYSTVKNN